VCRSLISLMCALSFARSFPHPIVIAFVCSMAFKWKWRCLYTHTHTLTLDVFNRMMRESSSITAAAAARPFHASPCCVCVCDKRDGRLQHKLCAKAEGKFPSESEQGAPRERRESQRHALEIRKKHTAQAHSNVRTEK
jgi:hypothetical protein